MASKNGKRVILGHPLVVGTAGTVLLLGWHMHALLSDIPRERVAAYAPQTLPPAPAEQPEAAPGALAARPRRPAAAPVEAGKKELPLAAAPAPSISLPLSAPPLAGGSAA